MIDSQSIAPKTDRELVVEPAKPVRPAAYDPNQRRLMVIALSLLLAVLGLTIYINRDFWFPDVEEAEDQPADNSPAGSGAASQPTSSEVAKGAAHSKPKRRNTADAKAAAPAAKTEAPPASTTTRTVLPPLEVEVVAGDQHRTVRPGSSSVRVDLQPGAPTQMAPDPVAANENSGNAAAVRNNAAERVQMSADTAEVVSRPVRPGYPLLARQMKVQGSVILQALIGKDGLIQDLHVLSGPPILASAAQDAVRQWHFKPHFQGTEAVETQAKITVNFTISTN